MGSLSLGNDPNILRSCFCTYVNTFSPVLPGKMQCVQYHLFREACLDFSTEKLIPMIFQCHRTCLLVLQCLLQFIIISLAKLFPFQYPSLNRMGILSYSFCFLRCLIQGRGVLLKSDKAPYPSKGVYHMTKRERALKATAHLLIYISPSPDHRY